MDLSLFRRGAGATTLALIASLLLVAPLAAQGTQTGVLTGKVESGDGQPLPGVSVTVRSAALQGERSAVSDENGGYIFRGLPAGDYRVTYGLTGFTSVERNVAIALGGTSQVNAALTVATVQETVEVTAAAPSALSTPQIASNYRGEEIDRLAVNRNLQAIGELAPNVSDNTPNAGQLTIAGAFAFDNVFLLNGVDINDNLFGTANNLFIEDAVQETQVLTSGISAEYGRFSGGVVNAITKSGGNEFSGSYRLDLTNPSWASKTVIEERNNTDLSDVTNRVHQATFGGPIVRDRVWFFAAGRMANITESLVLPNTNVPYDRLDENERVEGKLTVTPATNHTLSGTFIRNSTDQTQPTFAFTIDERAIISRTLPNNLFVVNYNGVLRSDLFVEAQYSQKKFGFRGSGSSFTDVVDSPFLARGLAGIPASRHFNAPYFDNSDPENRDNQQMAAALSYFVSSGSLGRHDLKFGMERYVSTRTGGNSQSSTDFVFLSDPVVVGGVVQRDANNRIIPNFQPGISQVQQWRPVRGATIDLKTQSFYMNDRWTLNDHWSFNLGARFEQVTSDATGVQSGADTTSLVPRLGGTFDVKGDGRYRFYATYSHYSGKASETQFADNTNVGTPNLVQYSYTGPAGSGLNFAPGFDLANYTPIGGSFPVANVFFADDLGTPITKEWTVTYGMQLGRRGELRTSFVNREITNVLDDRITLDNGRTSVSEAGRTFGPFDNIVVENTDVPHREYRAGVMEARYRVTDRWLINLNYTHQFRNHGNFEGEGANTPGSFSLINDYPELYVEARHFPSGRVDDFQADKIRFWTTYSLEMGRFGDVALGMLYRYDSPRTFSRTAAAQPFSAIQLARNPGYARNFNATTSTIFFGERGEGEFESASIVDFSLNYDVPVWKRFRPWVKAEVRNAFHNQSLIRFDTTLSAVRTPGAPVDADGIPTTFTEGANFGRPTTNAGVANAHLPNPRSFRVGFGFRF